MSKYSDELNLLELEREMLGINTQDAVPNVRDGLTRKQRTILYCLHQTQKEFGDRMVPTMTLYGRVLEYVDMSKEEFQTLLTQMVR